MQNNCGLEQSFVFLLSSECEGKSVALMTSIEGNASRIGEKETNAKGLK